MKKLILIALVLFSIPGYAFSQTGDSDKDTISIDAFLEGDARHNLEVAWQYFKTKKAYKAVVYRTEETIAAHPRFTKMDEVLYLAGMSSLYLSQGKGKQKIELDKLSEEDKERFAPDVLLANAKEYLQKLVADFPESKYKSKAEKALKDLKDE
ncbi:MAG: outer membrane protein assembly factor BamD [Pyrinomonadaceae bacterium]